MGVTAVVVEVEVVVEMAIVCLPPRCWVILAW